MRAILQLAGIETRQFTHTNHRGTELTLGQGLVLYDCPAFICNQDYGLDSLVMAIMESVWNFFFQIDLHVTVAIFE